MHKKVEAACCANVVNRATIVNNEAPATVFTAPNLCCQFNNAAPPETGGYNCRPDVVTVKNIRLENDKRFELTLLNSPKQSPCTEKGASINIFLAALSLVGSAVNQELLSSPLVSPFSLFSRRHKNKMLGGLDK